MTYYFSCLNCLAEFALNPEPYMKPSKPPQTAAKCGCAAEDDGKATCCCPPKRHLETSAPPAVPEMPTADTKVVCPVAGKEVDIANAVLS